MFYKRSCKARESKRQYRFEIVNFYYFLFKTCRIQLISIFLYSLAPIFSSLDFKFTIQNLEFI